MRIMRLMTMYILDTLLMEIIKEEQKCSSFSFYNKLRAEADVGTENPNQNLLWEFLLGNISILILYKKYVIIKEKRGNKKWEPPQESGCLLKKQ